jgi:hypothetical protein
MKQKHRICNFAPSRLMTISSPIVASSPPHSGNFSCTIEYHNISRKRSRLQMDFTPPRLIYRRNKSTKVTPTGYDYDATREFG